MSLSPSFDSISPTHLCHRPQRSFGKLDTRPRRKSEEPQGHRRTKGRKQPPDGNTRTRLRRATIEKITKLSVMDPTDVLACSIGGARYPGCSLTIQTKPSAHRPLGGLCLATMCVTSLALTGMRPTTEQGDRRQKALQVPLRRNMRLVASR